jgi:hypothetical protein
VKTDNKAEKCGEFETFGNNLNKSKSHSLRNSENFEIGMQAWERNLVCPIEGRTLGEDVG